MVCIISDQDGVGVEPGVEWERNQVESKRSCSSNVREWNVSSKMRGREERKREVPTQMRGRPRFEWTPFGGVRLLARIDGVD